jgi:hypothetical protein
MTGIVHLRIVTTIFVIGGMLAALPYTLSLFLDDPPPPLIGWIGGIACIAFAVWFSRGSNIARLFLIVFSILGLLAYGDLIFVVGEGTWLDTAVMGFFGILSGYSRVTSSVLPFCGVAVAEKVGSSSRGERVKLVELCR